MILDWSNNHQICVQPHFCGNTYIQVITRRFTVCWFAHVVSLLHPLIFCTFDSYYMFNHVHSLPSVDQWLVESIHLYFLHPASYTTLDPNDYHWSTLDSSPIENSHFLETPFQHQYFQGNACHNFMLLPLFGAFFCLDSVGGKGAII